MVFNEGQQNELLLNDGAGNFTRDSTTPLIERSDSSIGGAFADVDGDGDQGNWHHVCILAP